MNPVGNLIILHQKALRVGQLNLLGLGVNDSPHIVMVDRFTGELWYFWKNETGWQYEIIPNTQYSSYPDLVLDQFNQPHISYHKEGVNSGDLRYVTKDSTGWHFEV